MEPKLIIAIVSSTHSDDVIAALVSAHHQATMISTTGGFLRRGNATLLIGVQAERVDDVLRRIQCVCARKPGEADLGQGGATIFVLGVDGYLHG